MGLNDRLKPCLRWRMVPLALLSATLSAVPLCAQDTQDVAEAARQERERKAAQQNAPHHVYTEQDLKRNKILTQEDESRVTARKAVPPAPEKKNTEPQVVEQKQETESLGEVARYYREEKAARQAEEAAKNAAPSRYPLGTPGASLAEPKPEAAPNIGSLRADELKPRARAVAPVPRNSFPSRVFPFVPRDSAVPRSSATDVPLAVLAESVRREKVQPGDSWWRLASRYLGKGSRWEELLRVNPGLSRDPGRLMAGTLVFVPASARSRPAAPPSGEIIVHKGDTLWSLAREHLGCGTLWPQLAAANPGITQFTKLQIDSRLKLPEKRASACSSRQSTPARD